MRIFKKREQKECEKCGSILNRKGICKYCENLRITSMFLEELPDKKK